MNERPLVSDSYLIKINCVILKPRWPGEHVRHGRLPCSGGVMALNTAVLGFV